MTVIISKFNEVLYSVLPITVIVLLLHVTLTPVDTPLLIRFLIGAVSIIVGLTIFLVGVEVGITPIGNTMGSTIAKTNKMYIVAIAGLILGFIISIAEPDLHILAGQVDTVTLGLIPKSTIIVIVSVELGHCFPLAC